jgi:hypothetical protein
MGSPSSIPNVRAGNVDALHREQLHDNPVDRCDGHHTAAFNGSKDRISVRQKRSNELSTSCQAISRLGTSASDEVVVVLVERVANLLYTFEDRETGELRTIAAPNQSAARLRLGGIWTDVERTEAWSPCDIVALREMLSEAQVEEREAHAARLVANPMGKVAYTTAEAIADFAPAEERYRKIGARCSELARLVSEHESP